MRRRFSASFWMELRLIVLHWSFWLANGLWAVLNFSQLGIYQESGLSAENWMVGGLLRNTIAAVGFIVIVIAAVSASRADRARFHMLEKSYPVNVDVLFGRALAVLLSSLTFAIAPLVVAYGIGPTESFLRGLSIFAGDILITFTFIVAAVYTIHVMFGLRRWLYPLLMLAWIGGAMLPNVFRVDGLVVPGMALFNFPRSVQIEYSEMFGLILHEGFLEWFNLFYVGVIFLLCGIIIWRYHRRWMRRVSVTGYALIAMGFVLAGYNGVQHTLHTAEANQQFQEVTQASSLSEDAIPASELPYAITRYEIVLDVSEDVPQFDVQMQVVNQGDEPVNQLRLTLNHQLSITDSSVEIARDGTLITVNLDDALRPGETMTLDITYEGQLITRNRANGTAPVPDDFIFEDAIRLQFESYWYPLVGHLNYTYSEYLSLPDEPASIRLEVHGTDLTMASNLMQVEPYVFQSDQARWAMVTGSHRLAQVDNAPVTLVTGEMHAQRYGDMLTTVVGEITNQYQQFFPDIAGARVFFSDEFFDTLYGRGGAPTTGSHFFVQMLNWNIDRLADDTPDEFPSPGAIRLSPRYMMIHVPFAQGLYATDGSYLVDNAATFLYLHSRHDGDADAMRTQFDAIIDNEVEEFFLRTTGSSFFYNNQPVGRSANRVEQPLLLAGMFIDYYDENGIDATADLLQALRDDADTVNELEPDALFEWIESYHDED